MPNKNGEVMTTQFILLVENLDQLFHIAIERPELNSVDFEEVLDSCKQTNCRVRLVRIFFIFSTDFVS